MSNFETRYRPQRHFYSGHGDPVKVLYSPEFDKQGVMTLKESGRENLYDYIQSHRDSVDIHKILQRFEEGDVAALSKVQGQFGDFSQFPKTYAEMLNQVIEGENAFNNLPLDIREKFGHSFQQWLATAGSAEWSEKMGFRPTPAGVNNPSPEGAQAPSLKQQEEGVE